MIDMLVRLYDLPDSSQNYQKVADTGVTLPSTNNHAQGTRTPISDMIHCSTGHRIMLHWARGDEGPPSINSTASPSLIPIRRCSHQDQERPPPVPRTSHTNSNRDYTIKQGPSLHQTHWFTQIQLAGGSPTTWSAHTRSPTISHDLPRHGRPIDRQLTVPQPSWP